MRDSLHERPTRALVGGMHPSMSALVVLIPLLLLLLAFCRMSIVGAGSHEGGADQLLNDAQQPEPPCCLAI